MLVVHGGKEHSSVPAKLLGDVHCLDLTTCTWERVTPKRVTPKGTLAGSYAPAGHILQTQQQQQQQAKDQVQERGSSSSRGQQPPACTAGGQPAASGPGVMAGHVGAAYKGSALFFGGYNHPTSMQAQARILVRHGGSWTWCCLQQHAAVGMPCPGRQLLRVWWWSNHPMCPYCLVIVHT